LDNEGALDAAVELLKVSDVIEATILELASVVDSISKVLEPRRIPGIVDAFSAIASPAGFSVETPGASAFSKTGDVIEMFEAEAEILSHEMFDISGAVAASIFDKGGLGSWS
jgi:hypothetical protein